MLSALATTSLATAALAATASASTTLSLATPTLTATALEHVAIDEARLERQTRHERMRTHVKWLVASKVHGISNQAKLAGALGVSSPWLSQYMNGRNQHGPLKPSQLRERRADLLHLLRLHQLPTETPTAAEAAAAAAAAAEGAAAVKPPKPTPVAPVFAAAPKHAVLSVNLADVAGWQQGGQCHLMALGVPVLGDGRWVIPCPGGSEGRKLQLRVGLRGRRTLSARSHASVAGRTFEWWLEAIAARHEIASHGGPLWVAREVGSADALERIVGRAPRPGGGYTGPSSSELLWQAIARRCGLDAPRFTGIVQTGLIHPSVQALLEAVEEDGDGLPSLTGFGSRSGGVGGLRQSRLREIGNVAGTAFVQAMESVCPGDPEAAFAQLLKRQSFQCFLPERVRKALGKHALRDEALKLPFVTGLVEVYHKLDGFRTRRQHLALFAPFFPYKVTMELFGVTRWHVLMARLHAGEHGAERPVPPAVASFRVKPEAAIKLNAFANSPENVQIMACNGGKAHDCVVGLKQVPEKLWLKYQKETADWPVELRVERSSFLTFFNQPGCFQILRAKSCLCGPCHEHGTLNFEALAELIATLTPHLGAKVGGAIKLRAEQLHGYLAHEYRGHCALQSPVATQCISHALSGSATWSCECDHEEHDMSDARDNERFELVDDVRKLIGSLRDKRPAVQDSEEWEAMLDVADEDLSRFEHSLELYVQHLLRKALSSSITPRALKSVEKFLTRCHLIVDYKQKWLPVKHNETQSDSFGKRGKSIWGGCAIRFDRSTGDYQVLNVRIGTLVPT